MYSVAVLALVEDRTESAPITGQTINLHALEGYPLETDFIEAFHSGPTIHQSHDLWDQSRFSHTSLRNLKTQN